MSAPPLLAELLPPRSRSFILGLFFSCFYVGGLMAALTTLGSQNIQSTWSWRLPSLLQFLPSLISVAFLPFVPESVRWLIANGREEEATEVLAILAGEKESALQKAAIEMQEIKFVITKEEEMYPRNPWRELLSTPANRRRMLVYYLGRFLSQAGVKDINKQNQINVILQCWSFAIAVFGSFMLDIMGRRVQSLIGVGGATVTLFILGGMIKVYGNSNDASAAYGTISLIFLSSGFYSFSITPMTSLYPAEVCQYKLRAAGAAVFRFFDSAFGLLASFTTSLALSNLGWKFYLINASWNVIFFVFVYFFFVETKGLNLEEIAVRFGEDVFNFDETSGASTESVPTGCATVSKGADETRVSEYGLAGETVRRGNE
ncbi:hypothetical protein DRE_03972 [Drechslerella stenobrocha 248]|uniref:Major facilitator superfamily (MFS) profile domain-containing protein n=1 Tax=Drechslerella stenobrocha 248 TaxID=1043628 RepID=W7I2T2_9PEZI|nr:hypothetical protein DRE_03972 [Drechslerella stenobrocha 248]